MRPRKVFASRKLENGNVDLSLFEIAVRFAGSSPRFAVSFEPTISWSDTSQLGSIGCLASVWANAAAAPVNIRPATNTAGSNFLKWFIYLLLSSLIWEQAVIAPVRVG